MNNEIQRFDFRGASLRTLTDEAGEPWFVLKDCMSILDLGNPTETVKMFDKDEFSTTEVIDSIGRRQQTYIISEPGLYRLVMKSRKPEAKEFQRWVTHEVLPQIRRTGGYIPATDADDDMTILAKAVMIGKRTMEQQQRKITEQQTRIVELEPKARFADAVAASDDTCLVGELAKMLLQNGIPVGQNRLFRLLRAEGYLGKSGSNRNMPTQRAMFHGTRPVPHQGDHRHPCGRAHHGQPHSEGHGQGAVLFHRPVPGSYAAVVGSGCVMDKNMQRAMLSAFDDLRNRLITATQPKTSVDLIDSTFAMSSIGGRGLEQLREAAAAAAVLGQMEAVCRFLLEILYPAGVGEGVDDLLAAESDEIDSLREFPNLGILRGLLDSRGDAGSAGDVSSRLFECLSLCEHDSSPNCSARTSEMRDDTDFRRGPGGPPNAARHHTRKGGA